MNRNIWHIEAARLLDLAADEFSNHGCNDHNWPEDWNDDEKRNFISEIHKQRGTISTDEFWHDFNNLVSPQDWEWMRFLAKYLRQ